MPELVMRKEATSRGPEWLRWRPLRFSYGVSRLTAGRTGHAVHGAQMLVTCKSVLSSAVCSPLPAPGRAQKACCFPHDIDILLLYTQGANVCSA